MKKFASNPTLLLLATGFGLFAVLAFTRAQAPPSHDWQPVADVAPTPSADNVAPTVHARLMRLQEQLEAAPRDTSVLLQAARLQQDAHQLDAAAEHYERFLALSPRNHQVWLDLANVYAGQQQWDEAQRTSERMLDHYPDDPSAMYNLGAIHANQGRYDEARRWWTPVRDGAHPTLAEQAATSLAQLSGGSATRPSTSPSTSRVNPHATPHATLPMNQPVVARRVSSLPSVHE